MKIKDLVIAKYVRHVIMPRIIIIDTPGYIYEDFKKIGFNISLREIFIPESLLVDLEITLSKKKELLYTIGKKFGYQYASLSNLPTISNISRKDFERYAAFQMMFTEGTYAKKIKHSLDYESKTISIDMDGYIVCRKNGLGYLFSSGGIAGIWSYVCEDPTIEAVQTNCQGRKDKLCHVIAGPYKNLKKMGLKPITFTKLEKTKLGRDYNEINKIRPVRWARNSLKDLINSGLFQHSFGKVTYKDERFFLAGANFMYILEKELKTDKAGIKTLWDSSFEFGKRLAMEFEGKESYKFIGLFFPALGFGDILALKTEGKYKIIVNYFPWTRLAREIDFTMLRGMFSGLISVLAGRIVLFNKIKKSITREGFSLSLSE